MVKSSQNSVNIVYGCPQAQKEDGKRAKKKRKEQQMKAEKEHKLAKAKAFKQQQQQKVKTFQQSSSMPQKASDAAEDNGNEAADGEGVEDGDTNTIRVSDEVDMIDAITGKEMKGSGLVSVSACRANRTLMTSS